MRILIFDDDDFILQQSTDYLDEYFRKAGADCPKIVCYREGGSLLADQGEKDIGTKKKPLLNVFFFVYLFSSYTSKI